MLVGKHSHGLGLCYYDIVKEVKSDYPNPLNPPLISPCRSEEINRKAYNGLVKKLKKETGDKRTEAVRQLKQLFPIPKQSVSQLFLPTSKFGY